MSDSLVCADCGQPYVMTAQEKVRFQELVKNVQGFHMPKRCPECRRRRRIDRIPQQRVPGAQVARAPVAKVSVVGVTPMEISPPKPVSEVVHPHHPTPVLRAIAEESSEPQKEEVRFILATKDFEDLVHGRPIVWQGVRVLLADIGFKVMREAIERAETERAKIVFRKSGSA